MSRSLSLLLLLFAFILAGCGSAERSSTSSSSSTATASPTPRQAKAAHPPAKTSSGKKAAKSAKKGPDRAPAGDDTDEDSNNADALLQQAVDRLPMGQVAINHPEEMKVKQADVLHVRISRDQAADLTQGLPTDGHSTQRDQVPISTTMKVQVSGEPYFDVKPVGSEEQIITSKGFSEWSFTVIPLQSGDLPVHVRVIAVVRAAGIEKAKDFAVKDEIIRVRVSYGATIGDFVSNNWQWLWTTILVPVALWLWNNRRRKNKKGGPSPSTGADKTDKPDKPNKSEGHAA